MTSVALLRFISDPFTSKLRKLKGFFPFPGWLSTIPFCLGYSRDYQPIHITDCHSQRELRAHPVHWFSKGVPGPAAPGSSGNVLERQILKPTEPRILAKQTVF